MGPLDPMVVPVKTYVGVQLDDPVGEHSGVFRGKRFFECKHMHGTLVPAAEVVKFKPRNHVDYIEI